MPFYKFGKGLRQAGAPILVCLITLSLFVVAEVSVRFFAPQMQQRIDWNGVQATTSDQELRYVLTPSYRAVIDSAEFSPRLVEYKTSAQGFRDEVTYNEHRSAGTVRILIIGDSFAYGVASNYSEIWPVIFEKQLTESGYKVEVIKAGVMGYDTRQETIFLKRLLPKYKPDIVILAFMLNDLFTNRPLRAAISESRTDIQEANQVRAGLTAQKLDSLHLVPLAKRLLLKSDVLYTKIYMESQRGTYFDPQSAALQRQLTITKELLLEGATYAAANGSKFVVLSIPQAFQVINSDKNLDVSLVDKELGHFAQKAGFSWFSSLPIFLTSYAQDKADLHYRLDGHLNAKGNRLVGDFLAAKFADDLGSKIGKPMIESADVK